MNRKITVIVAIVVFLFIVIGVSNFKITRAERKIKSLTKQYGELEQTNRTLTAQYYNSTEIATVENIAINRLGMTLPDSYIIVEIKNAR